jgi:hypothetical protein
MNFPTSQMPQPPSPDAIDVAGPGLSEPERLIDTFVAPSKTFTDIRRNASWWVPWLLSAICAVAFFMTVGKKVGFDEVAQKMFANNNAVQQLPEAQRDQIIARTATGFKVGMYIGPIFILLYAVIIAAVLMATFNFVMAAEVSFSRSLAIVMYGWLPNLVGSILAIITLFFADPEGFRLDNPVGTNPAYFLDPTTTSKFVYSFLTSFDVASLWCVALMGMGFALNSKKKISTGSAIGTVAIWFFIYKLCAAGFASLR